MGIEISYRMTRLRAQAEHEQLATGRGRRISVRSRVGHAVMALGRVIEGAGAQETECPSPLHA